MGERKRHHIVPRFMLKRFASDVRGDTSFIWRFPIAGEVANVSTRDAPVESQFYGSESEGLEAALSKAEGGWGALVRKIDAGKALEPLGDELWQFMYALGVRATAMRSAFGGAFSEFLSHLDETAHTRTIRDGFQRLIPEQLDKLLAEQARKLPPPLRPRMRKARLVIYRQLQRQLDEGLMGAMLKGAVAGLEERNAPFIASKDGHNRAIAKLLADPDFGKRFRPLRWTMVVDGSRSFVLGDNPLIAAALDQTVVGSPWNLGHENTAALYLPLSPSQVLVGVVDPKVSLLSPDQIRAASASVSQTAFFACRNTDSEQQLRPLIGRNWSPLPPDKLSTIIRDSVQTFGKGHSLDDAGP
jgi:hypothetical protein